MPIGAVLAGIVGVPADISAGCGLGVVVRQVVVTRAPILRAALYADSPGSAACRAAAAIFRLFMAVVAVTDAGVRAVVIQYPGAIVMLQRADFFLGGVPAVPADKIGVPAALRAGRCFAFMKLRNMKAGQTAVFSITHCALGLLDAGRRAASMQFTPTAYLVLANITFIDPSMIYGIILDQLPPYGCKTCKFTTRITMSHLCQRSAADSD